MLRAKIKSLYSSLLRSSKRFPLTVIFTTLLTVLFIIRYNFLKPVDVIKSMMIIHLGIPLSLIAQFVLERWEKPSRKALLTCYGIALLILLLYSLFWLPVITPIDVTYSDSLGHEPGYYLDPVGNTRYIAVSLALYLIALALPFFGNKENIELYVIKLVEQLFITLAFALVLAIGLMAIFGAIESLFSINFYGNLYSDLWIIVMGIFAPIHFLSGVPLKNEKLSDLSFPKVLKILLLYIIMPLITIYTAILYLYFLKILVTLTWPEGVIGGLVLWYGAATTIVMFLIHPLRKENSWAELFSKWLSRLILPLIVLMFVSMGIRINAYGVTENRYFVLALGV